MTETYASRAGGKLAGALDAFGVTVEGEVAADFGSSAGGFVDVLLRRGARKVYAVEIGKGLLDWGLRNDERVVVMEKTDAREVTLPEPADIITIDAGFVPQREIVPHALTMLKEGGVVISLVKPQYEAKGAELKRGGDSAAEIEEIEARVLGELRAQGIEIAGHIPSAVKGGKAEIQESFILIRR